MWQSRNSIGIASSLKLLAMTKSKKCTIRNLQPEICYILLITHHCISKRYQLCAILYYEFCILFAHNSCSHLYATRYTLFCASYVFLLALANTLPFHFPVLNARLLSNYSQLPDNYLARNKFYPANNKLKKNQNCI